MAEYSVPNLITPESLKLGCKDKPIQGIILVKDYGQKTAKNGKPYYTGILQAQDTLEYKIWNNVPAFDKLAKIQPSNTPCFIVGKFDEYNGVLSINIDDIEKRESVSLESFIPTVYNKEQYFECLNSLCKDNISEKGMAILKIIFFENKNLINSFKTEFAAKSFHDNCKSGLLVHTYKVLSTIQRIIDWYPTAFNSSDKKDLVYIGALLHDIGKINEMSYGVYAKPSVVTHRGIGHKFICKHEDKFVAAYGQEWFYHLEAIILQHHDEFAEPCKSLYAYFVHLADCFDSDLTYIDQNIQNAVDTPAGKILNVRGKMLTVLD